MFSYMTPCQLLLFLMCYCRLLLILWIPFEGANLGLNTLWIILVFMCSFWGFQNLQLHCSHVEAFNYYKWLHVELFKVHTWGKLFNPRLKHAFWLCLIISHIPFGKSFVLFKTICWLICALEFSCNNRMNNIVKQYVLKCLIGCLVKNYISIIVVL